MSETFSWAWFAGFVDGEGCLYLCHATNTTWSPQLSICQKNLPVLRYIQKALGSGAIPPSTIKRETPIIYFSRNSLTKILPKIIPFLQIKREQAELLLEACRLNGYIRKHTQQPYMIEGYHKQLEDIDTQLRNLKHNAI